MRHRERGQVLPVWIIAIFALTMLTFFAINFANVVRWQVRAQNAADAAAQALVTTQTQSWNHMELMLWSSAVEEWRIRRLLDALRLVVHQSGGCSGRGTCQSDYVGLRAAFLKAVQRYTVDVALLQKVSSSATYTNWGPQRDARYILADLQSSCGKPNGGDCAFAYNLVGVQQRTNNVGDVSMDALAILEPGLGIADAAAAPTPELFAPMMVDVAVCKVVPAITPNFFGLHVAPFVAIGRAAATAVMVEEDWMQPGTIVNPFTNKPFQPVETYAATPGIGTYDWYSVDFGGNGAVTFPVYNAYQFQINVDEFSQQFGWWNSIPIKPFATITKTTMQGCS